MTQAPLMLAGMTEVLPGSLVSGMDDAAEISSFYDFGEQNIWGCGHKAFKERMRPPITVTLPWC